MGSKIKKISEWNFYQRLFRFFLLWGAIFSGLFYLGVLIRPDTPLLIENPELHQAIAILVIIGIIIGIVLLTAIFVAMCVDVYKLTEENKKKDQKLEELEAELKRLRKDE